MVTCVAHEFGCFITEQTEQAAVILNGKQHLTTCDVEFFKQQGMNTDQHNVCDAGAWRKQKSICICIVTVSTLSAILTFIVRFMQSNV